MISPIVPSPGGKAFSTAWHALTIPWDKQFGQLPITIEARARPKLAKEWLVTCVNPDGAGWGLVVGSQGELAAFIADRTRTRWIWNLTPILDERWHHLAMGFDGNEVKLLVDGVQSHQDEIVSEPMELPSAGLHLGSSGSIVCEALIESIKLSAGERTIGHWRVGDDDRMMEVEGRFGAGVVTAIPQESLDDFDRREFRAGPAPLDVPERFVQLTATKIKHPGGPAILSLDGEWEMAEGGAWDQAVFATVPGSVHGALEAAGKIPDPKSGFNDAIAREQSFKSWWFRAKFSRPSGSGHCLIFDGVAIHCTVWLNGRKLGEHEGMFGGPEFEIADLLHEENDLIVKLDPAPTGPPWFAPTANTGWKKTVVFNNVYGWHYCHIPALGIWRSVRVEASPAVKLRNPFVVTHDAALGDVSIRVDLRGQNEKWSGTLNGTIEPENFPGDTRSFSLPISAESRHAAIHLRTRISNPQLWWPNGLGEQNLYRLKMSFQPDGSPPSDFCQTTFGLRTIEMAPLPGGPRRSLYNWQFVINRRPVFMKGTGWCTMDASMDFRRERYERFLQLAKEENCQMLRCWGSGMPETDDFYDLCDRLGLAVMQEWPTAWNSHEEQPFDALEETVRLNTLRLRNHPSLVMWGGGNESSKPFGKAIDSMGRLAIELDSTRPFHRGEPWGGSDHNYGCWWGKAHLDLNLKMTSRFFGEFGIPSLSVMESVRRYLPPEESEVWPPKEDGVFAHHTPVFNTMEDMARLRQYAGYFSAGKTIERFIEASQIAQAVAARHTLERARTRWPQSAGALLYKLNDNYPGASWSTVDWYGASKISHYFVQDAFAPLHACVLFDRLNNIGKSLDLPVFLLDDADALNGKDSSVNIRAYDADLRLIDAQEFVGSGSIDRVRRFGEFHLTEKQTNSIPLFVVAEVLIAQQLIDRTFYFLNFEPKTDCLFDLSQTTLSISVTEGNAIVKNTGSVPAVAAAILRPGHLATFSVSDNYFWLEPGESKSVHVSDVDGLLATAWNSPPAPSQKGDSRHR